MSKHLSSLCLFILLRKPNTLTMPKPTPIYQPDYDTRWKILLDQFADAAVKKFFPNIAKQRNHSKPIEPIEKELQKIFADWKKKGWTIGDKLMKVPLLNGKEKLVLIHFEIQMDNSQLFKKLMWRRGYRIVDKYPDTDFTAIAVYLGKYVPPNPGKFVHEYEGTRFTYEFNTFLIKDQNEEELLASDNPIDIAILAMFYVQKANGDVKLLEQYKRKLAKSCFEKNFTFHDAVNLCIFVMYSIAVPEELNAPIKNEIVEIMENIDHTTTQLRKENLDLAIFFEKTFLGYTLDEKNAEYEQMDREREKREKEWEQKREKEKQEREKEKQEREKEKQEREKREKEIIIRHIKFGLKADQIASLLDVPIKRVKKIIQKIKKK